MRPPKNLKIVFAFFLGIGLPSLMLGYLAWRGIRNDRALVERDRLNRCEAMAMRIQQRLDDQCRILAEAVAGLSGADHGRLFSDRLRSEYPLIEALFTVNPGGKIQFPEERLIYSTWDPLPEPAPLFLGGSSDQFEQGETFEFVHQQYGRAEECYRRAMEEAGTDGARAQILCALARVQKKSGHFDDALDTYRQLDSQCGSVALIHGLPARAIAGLERGAIHCRMGEFRRSFYQLGRLYHEILEGRMRLAPASCDWLIREVRNRIEETANQAGSRQRAYLDSLGRWKLEEERKRERCRRLTAFHERAEAYFTPGWHESESSFEGGWKEIVMEGPGAGQELCLLFRNPDPDHDRWGILLDTGYLKTALLPSLLNECIGSESMEWIVRGESGEPLIQKKEVITADLVMQSSFHDRFPPWILEFHEADPPLLEALFFSRRSIYVYVFFLIGFVLMFGLSLTYRAVHREMELTRIKTDFVTAVSHDFKNPLTSIRQLSEMLEAGRVPTEEKRRKYYHVILEQSDRLKFMVSNIVDYAKMEKGNRPFNFEMINPAPLIQRVVAEAQNRLLNTDFTLQARISTRLPFIRGDAAALQQALNNLIDNAVKFSEKRKRVQVRAICREGGIHISVRDWGVGIDEREREKIFREFYRVQSPVTRKVKGSGLGLTLVRQVASAHHGKIQVKSEPGRGSTFTLILPYAEKPSLKEKG